VGAANVPDAAGASAPRRKLWSAVVLSGLRHVEAAGGASLYIGNANVWAPSADEELGYVYLPVITPTNDHYGGHRPGDGLSGDSLICLDAATDREGLGTTNSRISGRGAMIHRPRRT